MIKWQTAYVHRQARDRVIVAYRICGLGATYIAEALSLSTTTVYAVLRSYGINNRRQSYYELYRFSRKQLALPGWLPDRGLRGNGLDAERGERIEAELIEREFV